MNSIELLQHLQALGRNGQRVRILELALQDEALKTLYNRMVTIGTITTDGRLTKLGKQIIALGASDDD